jgi:hypothetical protein
MSLNAQTRRLSQRTREMKLRTSFPWSFSVRFTKGEALIGMPPALESA